MAKSTEINMPVWLTVLRIISRAVALIVAAFILFMFVGEGGFWSQPPDMPLTIRDYLLLSVMGLYWLGLILGLWWELLGGLTSLIFILILIINLQLNSTGGIYFNLMMIPCLLYILDWYLHYRIHKYVTRNA